MPDNPLILHDLGPPAVAAMQRADLAGATEEPASPIGHFDFAGRLCGVASYLGTPPWELHTEGDELLHILSGECRLTIRGTDGDVTRTLRAGELVVVPRGCWHRSESIAGVTLFYMTPHTGNRHSASDPND